MRGRGVLTAKHVNLEVIRCRQIANYVIFVQLGLPPMLRSLPPTHVKNVNQERLQTNQNRVQRNVWIVKAGNISTPEEQLIA